MQNYAKQLYYRLIESTQKEIDQDDQTIASYTKAIANTTWVSTQL
jgi:hypothetical protein